MPRLSYMCHICRLDCLICAIFMALAVLYVELTVLYVPYSSAKATSSASSKVVRYHRQPEVNYPPCFKNDDLPCRLHVFHVFCRVNHHSRNRVNSSLQVAGGSHVQIMERGVPLYTADCTCLHFGIVWSVPLEEHFWQKSPAEKGT